MDIGMSTIGNMFAGTAGPGSAQSVLTTSHSARPDTAIVYNWYQADNLALQKTYNNGTDSQDNTNSSLARVFSHVPGEEVVRNKSSDNRAEIEQQQTHRQHDAEQIGAQFALQGDIAALNLPVSPHGQPRPALGGAEVSNGAIADLNEQQVAKNPGRLALPPAGRVIPAPMAGAKASEQHESVGAKTLATQADGKRPLIDKSAMRLADKFLQLAQSKSLDTHQEVSQSPKKSQLAVEKPLWPPARNFEFPPTADRPLKALKNYMQFEIRSGQTKNSGSSGSNTRSAVDTGVAASKPAIISAAMAGHPIIASPNHPLSCLEATSNVTTGISQQIAISIKGSLRQGDTQLTIYLNPPELGRVFVRFQQQQDQITILLEVSKPETRCEIELALPQIMRALQDCGAQVRRLEVSVPARSDELAQQADKELVLGGQDNDETAQYNSTPEGDHDKPSGQVHEWLISTSIHRDYRNHFAPQIFGTNGSINMLI